MSARKQRLPAPRACPFAEPKSQGDFVGRSTAYGEIAGLNSIFSRAEKPANRGPPPSWGGGAARAPPRPPKRGARGRPGPVDTRRRGEPRLRQARHRSSRRWRYVADPMSIALYENSKSDWLPVLLKIDRHFGERGLF